MKITTNELEVYQNDFCDSLDLEILLKEEKFECNKMDIKELIFALLDYYKKHSEHYGVADCYFFTKEFNFHITNLMRLDKKVVFSALDHFKYELINIFHGELSQEIDIYADKLCSFKLNEEKHYDELIVYTPYKPIKITLRTEL